MPNITINNQTPVKLYSTGAGGIHIPTVKLDLDAGDYLNAIRDELIEQVVDPFFNSFNGSPVEIKNGKDTIEKDDLANLVIGNILNENIDPDEEELLKDITEASLKTIQKNTWPFSGQLVQEVLAKYKLPSPATTPRVIKYTVASNIIPQAKALLADTTDATEKELWFAYLGAYLENKTDGVIVTVKSAKTWDTFKQHLDQIVQALTSSGNLSSDTINMFHDLSQVSLKNELQTALIINNHSMIGDIGAIPNQPYSFARILMNAMATETALSPDDVFLQPISLGQVFFPENLIIINLEEYAHAKKEDILKEWTKTNKGLAIAKQLKIVSLKKLRNATAVARTNSQQQKTNALNAKNIQGRALQRKFSAKPVSSKKLIKMMMKVMKNRETSKMTSNTYTVTKPTFMRPNRRRPNDPNAMGKSRNIKYRPDVHIYIDTSGSISEQHYHDAVMNLIMLAKKSQVNLYVTTFSHYITETTQLHVQGHSIAEVYQEFMRAPKAQGGTEYSLVWRKILAIDKWNKKNNKSYQLNFLITDFEYWVPKGFTFQKGLPYVDNLYYVPISTDLRNWDRLKREAEDFAKSMIIAGDTDIKQRMLL